MSKDTTKVNGNVSNPKNAAPQNKVEKPKAEKPARPKRTLFPIKSGEKVTLAVPNGFSFDTYLPLKKNFFEKSSDFLKHRAAMLNWQSAKLAKAANELNQRGERLAALGDEKTAKKVKKVERMQKNLADLMSELKNSGVNVEEILSAIKAPSVTTPTA
jgi:hypothetical protein